MKILHYFSVLFLLLCFTMSQKYKADSYINLNCQFTKKVEIYLRTYAITLIDAVNNVQIQLEGLESQSTSTKKCILNKDNQICLFQNFVYTLTIMCKENYEEAVNLQVIEPLEINELTQEDKSRNKAIVPFLGVKQRGIATFTPVQSFAELFPSEKNVEMLLKEIFLSNCLKSIVNYEESILIGVQGVEFSNCIIMSKIEGFWIFQKANDADHVHPLHDFALPHTQNRYSFTKQQNINSLSILLKTESRNLINSFSFILQASSLIDDGNELSKQIMYKGEMYPNQSLPIQIEIYFDNKKIQNVYLNVSHQMHYSIKFSAKERLQIQQNQLLFYVFQDFENTFKFIGKIERQLHSHKPKEIGIYTKNITKIEAKNEKDSQLQIGSDSIMTLPNSDSSSFIQRINFEVNPDKNQKNSYFSVLLRSVVLPIEIPLDKQVFEFLFPQEIKHFKMQKRELQKLSSQKINKISIKHGNCHIFATYDEKCKEIACCTFSHADIIPIKGKDLFIFVKNSYVGQKSGSQSLIWILINGDKDNYTLSSGKIVEGTLSQKNLYIFQSKTSKVQIICSSILQSTLLLVNVDKEEFPSKNSFEYQSNEGYIVINSKKKTIYITILKILSTNSYSKKISFSLVAVDKDDSIKLQENVIFNDYYRRKSQRKYELKHICNNNEKVESRINMKNQGSISLGSQFHVKYSNGKTKMDIEHDFTDFSYSEISTLFQSENVQAGQNHEKQICTVTAIVKNPTNSNFHANAIFFKGKKSQQLLTGRFSSENLLSDEPLKIFSSIDPQKPTNIYIYSLIEEIKVSVDVKQVTSLKEINEQSFPKVQNNPLFSQHFYFPAKNPSKSDNLEVILISILKAKAWKNDETDHRIKLICTQDHTRIRSGGKLYYKLEENFVKYFQYQLGEELLKTKHLQFEEVVLQTAKIVGNYDVKIRLMYEDQVFEIDEQKQINTISKNIHPTVVVKVDLLKQKLKSINLEENSNKIILQFAIKCLESAQCTFLTSIQTSNSQIRQLIPGNPQIFRIQKHSMIIFVYSNYLSEDEDFKFKINRKQGFPNYQICSSKQRNQNQYNKCLEKLQLSEKEDMNIFNSDQFELTNFVSGRTHELDIDSKNPYYCINCVYYLALYSRYDVIEGSIYVITRNQPLMIEEGNSLTTIVYRNYPDKYFVPSKNFQVIIYEIEGKVNISTTSSGQIQPDMKHLGNIISIKYGEVEEELRKPFHLTIIPDNNEPSALYTLMSLNSLDKKIFLKDGVPYEMKFNESKLVNYIYKAQKSGLLVVSTKQGNSIEIDAKCEDVGKEQEKILIKKASQLRTKRYIMIDPSICEEYSIKIGTKYPNILYNLLVSSSDIITLPLGKQTPTILRYQVKLYQIYEVTVRQSTEIIGIMKFCKSGDGRFMISSNKSKLYKEDYDVITDITDETSYQQFKYQSAPGVFYIKVEFKGLGGILEYTIFVQNSSKLSEEKELTIYESRRSVRSQVKSVNHEYSEFQILFYPIYLNLQVYQITYFAVESNRIQLLERVSNCNGQFFIDLASQHEQIKETKLNFTKEEIFQNIEKHNPLRFKYRTKSPYNFLNIVPIIYDKNTQTTFHKGMPKYIPVELKDGQIYSALTYFLGEIALYVQKYINIHESQRIILYMGGILSVCCCLGLIALGAWLGSKFCSRTQTVYVLREISQQENINENEEQNERMVED